MFSYSHADHPTRINYYSTPDSSVRVNGQLVGEAGLSDNRGVIEASAPNIQSIGDESGSCPAKGKYCTKFLSIEMLRPLARKRGV